MKNKDNIGVNSFCLVFPNVIECFFESCFLNRLPENISTAFPHYQKQFAIHNFPTLAFCGFRISISQFGLDSVLLILLYFRTKFRGETSLNPPNPLTIPINPFGSTKQTTQISDQMFGQVFDQIFG